VEGYSAEIEVDFIHSHGESKFLITIWSQL